jgi:hypothetical protein
MDLNLWVLEKVTEKKLKIILRQLIRENKI